MTNKEFLESVSLEGEQWKDVVGYEGMYAVSNLGRVAGLYRITVTKAGWCRSCKPQIMKPKRNCKKTGHLVIYLCKNGKHNPEYVHRMVALAFIPNPNNLPMVEHLDCDATNNKIHNLRWTTQSGNMNNPITIKRMSESQRKKRLPMLHKPVVCISSNGETKFYKSMSETVKDGFRSSSVSICCSGKIKTHRNCRWMYLSDYENLKSVSQRTLESVGE